MLVDFVFLVLLLISFMTKDVSAQFSFEFMQAPIADTVIFNQQYDFIVIGAGSG